MRAQRFQPALDPDGFLMAFFGSLLHPGSGAREPLHVLLQNLRAGLGDPGVQRIQGLPHRRFPCLKRRQPGDELLFLPLALRRLERVPKPLPFGLGRAAGLFRQTQRLGMPGRLPLGGLQPFARGGRLAFSPGLVERLSGGLGAGTGIRIDRVPWQSLQRFGPSLHFLFEQRQPVRHRIHALRPAPPPPQTVFIEISADPLYTLGRDPLTNDLLARCGGTNPYATHAIPAPQVSVESVLHLNPQVLIVSPYGRETLAARRAWWAQHGLAAALAGRIYAVDPDLRHRPGPRLVDAAEAICADLRNAY